MQQTKQPIREVFTGRHNENIITESYIKRLEYSPYNANTHTPMMCGIIAVSIIIAVIIAILRTYGV